MCVLQDVNICPPAVLQERMTLKHSSHSKWAKRILRSGTKNTDVKKLLSDTHQLGHQLKEKLVGESHDEYEAEQEEDQALEESSSDGEGPNVTVGDARGNPWLSASAIQSHHSQNKSGSTGDKTAVSSKKEVEEEEEEEEEGLTEVSGHTDVPTNVAPTGDTNTNTPHALLESGTADQPDKPKKPTSRRKGKQHNIDVSNILTLATDPGAGSLEQVEKAKKQLLTIKSAFADDDVVQEFLKEKCATEDAERDKDIDLTLPGWGEWAGEGVKASKKPRVIKKAKPQPPRRDTHLKYVIISEARDRKAAKHQVRSWFCQNVCVVL